MSNWYWLSFCNPDLPAGSQFLGAVAIEVAEGNDPVSTAWDKGLNPGGEVAIVGPLSEELVFAHVPPDKRNCLLSRAEAENVS